MRDEMSSKVADRDLLDALTGSEIALVADAATLQSHSCQTAFVTAALLTARSGHTVYLVAPDVPLVGKQPPLSKDWRGWISPAHEVNQWPSDGWPVGALAAADLVASEAFKIAMRKLRRFA